MKYENPFHRLPLEKETFDVKIYLIPVEIRSIFRCYSAFIRFLRLPIFLFSCFNVYDMSRYTNRKVRTVKTREIFFTTFKVVFS